jgi:hypothetical protein
MTGKSSYVTILAMTSTILDMPEKTAPLTAEDVLKYLKAHPEFLAKNPGALDLLMPPKASQGKGIADFQSYMIQRLKADKDEVVSATREIVENARSNMNNQQRIHAAVLRLLEAQDFGDFINCITMDLANLLHVDIAVLLIESNGRDIPHIHQNGIRILPPGTIDQWMMGKMIYRASKPCTVAAQHSCVRKFCCAWIYRWIHRLLF